MKLQNILDLSTFEITRFRIWNQTSQPSDKGLGSKYFNTNSGHEAYGREQIYTPIGWRTAAYMDDIEAINEKLDLIFGDEIDTDTIIDSWKEVQNFLAGIEDTTTLMTMLNGKLDKSGGTITGDGVTIAMTGYPFIRFKSEDTMWGFIGFSDKGVPSVWDTTAWRTLIHAGNIESYAVLAGKWYDTGVEPARNSTGVLNGVGAYINVGYNSDYWLRFYVDGSGLKFSSKRNDSELTGKAIAFTDSDITGYAAGLKHANGTVGATVIDTGRVAFSGNISLELGKSILDPTGRSIFKLDSDNCPQIGFDTAVLYSTYINGKDVYLRYGSSRTTGLILNSSGNVLIGGNTTDTGERLQVDGLFKVNEATNRRFYTRISASTIQVGRISSFTSGYKAGVAYGVDGTVEGYIAGLYTVTRTNTQYFFYGGTEDNAPLIIRNGSVLIGTTGDDGSGANLQVAGLAAFNGGALIPTGKNMMFGDASGNAIMEYDEDAGAIKITGSVYATGTVASGGKAQEGTGTGGSATVYTLSLPYGQSAYQLYNPKSDTNVIVQVYEWNATTSSWDLILTDVNVTASKITVTFGRTTTVNHMVTVV